MDATILLSQTPVNAAADTKTVSGCAKTSSENKGPSEFKKKLEDCVALEDGSPYGLPTVPSQISGNNDNSMATDSVAQQVTPEIVGILEGFGLLLDYQPDPLITTTENAQTLPLNMQTTEGTVNTAFILPEGQIKNAQEPGAFEQYARMLSNGQFGLLGQDEQQAILKAVGEYLGSLESTNKNQIYVPETQDAALETGTVQTGTAQTETVQTNTATLEDKLISLLMKVRAAQNVQAAPQTEQPQAQTQTVKALTTDTPVATEGVQSLEIRTTSQQTVDKADTDLPEAAAVKPISTDVAPEQTMKTDTAMQSGIQTGVKMTQDVSQTETKAQLAQTTQTDFVKDNVMRIVDKMSTQTSQGRYDFDVELKPDFLGRVNIKITMENGEIRMQIKTEDLGVKGMFTDQTSAMQTALKEKGIAVSNIDVTYQSQMQNSDGRKSFQDGSGSFAKKQSTRHQTSLEQIMSGGFYGTMAETPGYDWSGSSVEYLA